MDLHKAFKMFVTKYYEGFDYSETKKVSSKPFEYDFASLDKLHKSIVNREPPIEEEEDSSMEDEMAMDDQTEDDAEEMF